jgi:cellulose synthase/poly-beta-1,6-N-acetylglucosamine synthase-like glycosyltransferase
VLERSSLARVVQPFLEYPHTIATGGTVRIANGCTVRDGFLERIRLPNRVLPLLQIVEYLRAFLFGRFGWTPLNAVLIISGAFGIFRRDAVVEVGGYRTDTIGEDMELVVRLHRSYRLARRHYRITFVPDPICWTEAPESLKVLKNQRIRWQRGLAESLTRNKGLLFHRHGGAPGWFAFPFMMVFEFLGPLIEVTGYVFTLICWAFGLVSFQALLIFLMVAIGFGIALSLSSLLLEELAFRTYSDPRQVAILAVAAIAENLGYRQLVSVWRLWGLWKWMTGAKQRWGDMARSGTWHRVDR